jgi:hypothetical protein
MVPVLKMIERSDSLILGISDHFRHSIVLLHQKKKHEAKAKIYMTS